MKKSLTYTAAKLWNSLSNSARRTENTKIYKTILIKKMSVRHFESF